jgi:hypothetical protein
MAVTHQLWVHDISSVLPENRAPERRDPGSIDTIALHCTGVPGWNVWDVARYHTGPNHISLDGCPTICYAYFIEPDGLIYRCLPLDVRSWHAGPWNGRAVGVCMASGGIGAVPDRQLGAAAELCAALALRLSLSPDRVLGHRELEGSGYVIEDGRAVNRKECPGAGVDMDTFRRAVGEALARPFGPFVRNA